MSDPYDDFRVGFRVRHSCLQSPVSKKRHTVRNMMVREGTVRSVSERGIHVAFDQGGEGVYDRRWFEIANADLDIIPQ
jgi:hypothetical protein